MKGSASTWQLAFLLAGAVLAPGCGGDEEKKASGACSLDEQKGCDDGMVCQAVAGADPACFCSVEAQTGCKDALACETVQGSNSACFSPITVKGRVFDLADESPVEGARVVARDANNAAASGIAVTDAAGLYSLAVPTPRQEDGTPISRSVTLRADAGGYLGFPRPPRVALPFDLANASGDPMVIESTATDIGLVALTATSGLGAVSGKVLADAPWGTVVVAGAETAVADRDGTYTVFNVPAGTVTVSGYKVGLQLQARSASVEATKTTEGIDLESLGEATAVVSGKVALVNAPGGATTSVILTVEDTFDENAARGEAPPGLRVGNVSGDFTIEGVPDGRYVVLAAFENDLLVRDPDTSIGGTSIVHIQVAGQSLTISEGFKVTGALEVVSPDAEQEVTGTPSFVWRDDSGEDHYEVRVFDAFGQLVWEDTAVPGVSGNRDVSVAYGGPTLEAGRLYQFRATSIKQGGTPIAVTEDLRGVFVQR